MAQGRRRTPARSGAFGLARAESIAGALRPPRIVVIGLGTLAGILPRGMKAEDALRDEKRVFVRRGGLMTAAEARSRFVAPEPIGLPFSGKMRHRSRGEQMTKGVGVGRQ